MLSQSDLKLALNNLISMPPTPFDLVYARCLNYGIGFCNSIPWRIPEDLSLFRKITTSGPNLNTVIMGRKTFESIGKPLPNRYNIVVSKQSRLSESSSLGQARSLTEALKLAESQNKDGKIYVVGGSKLYEEALAECRYIYETLVAKEFQCDAFAPKHSYPCSYVSKTRKCGDLIYDYRVFYNNNKFQPPAPEDLHFNLPAHEELQYIRMIEKIIAEGEQRTDRTGTGTRSLFGGMMRYDLRETFPLLTHKKVFWRGVAQELIWFISGSTDARVLEDKKIHIWDGNSSKEYLKSIGIDRESGDLGPVYGYQWRHWNAPYVDFNHDYTSQGIDQLQWIIDEIKRNPFSRRLILTAWNPGQLNEMALPPCHLMCQFQVTNDKRLNCIMYQRSCDMGLGVPFNIASYSLLTCMVAQVTGLERGEFIHMMGDMHVYNDHIEPLKQLSSVTPYPFPALKLDPNVKDISDFRMSHVQLEGYLSHPKIAMKMSV